MSDNITLNGMPTYKPKKGSAGKGDKRRPENKSVYDSNFDKLDWGNADIGPNKESPRE